MPDQTPLERLEREVQRFVDATEADGDGSPGLVTDWFLAIGYTRIDGDGDQPFSRRYAGSTSPYGSVGIAELCLADCRVDLSEDA